MLGRRVTITGLDFSSAPRSLLPRPRRRCRCRRVDYVESSSTRTRQRSDGTLRSRVHRAVGDALCWLPEPSRARALIVAALRGPAGASTSAKAHPVLWSLAEPRPDGLLVIEYPYFETERRAVLGADDVRRAERRRSASPDISPFQSRRPTPNIRRCSTTGLALVGDRESTTRFRGTRWATQMEAIGNGRVPVSRGARTAAGHLARCRRKSPETGAEPTVRRMRTFRRVHFGRMSA